MIIKSIYISSFGKLRNYTLNFNQNINVVLEENGWGKSTVAVFIKAMFYGLNDSKRSVEENERLKYKPWNSLENFGGNLVFVWKDKEYKIERFFGSKSSEDSVKLYDNLTGKEFTKTELLGERIFQIDEEGFYSTTYFSQKDLAVKTNSTLTSKYSAGFDGEDVEKFDKILQKIENDTKRYKIKGDKGLIYQTKKEILEIEDKIERAKKSSDVISSLKIELQSYQNEFDLIKNQQKEINDKLLNLAKSKSILFKKERIDKNQQKLNEIGDKIKDIDVILNKKDVNLEEHQLYVDCVNDFEKAQAIKNVLADDVKKLQSPQKTQNSKVSYVFMSLSILCLLFSIGSFFVDVIIGLILLAPTVIFGCLWLINGKGKANKDLLTEKINELKKFTELSYSMEEKIKLYLSKFAVDSSLSYQERLTLIYNAFEQKKNLLSESEEIIKEVKDLKSEVIGVDSEFVGDSEQTLGEKLNVLNKLYKEKLDLVALTNSKINHYTQILDSVSELENDKEITSEKLSNYVTHYNILTKTLEFMKQANENMKIRYREPLKNSFSKYIKKVFGEKEVDIDIDFKVSVVENGQQKSTDFYSQGLKNIFNICKRFALIDVLFKDEKPFIILDDPFVNLDVDNFNSVKKIIEILKDEYQVIYFTCHDSRGL